MCVDPFKVVAAKGFEGSCQTKSESASLTSKSNYIVPVCASCFVDRARYHMLYVTTVHSSITAQYKATTENTDAGQ